MSTTTSSSTRRTRLRRAAGLLVIGGASLLAACSTPTPKEADLTSALIDSGVAKPVAECTAAALVDSLTSAELQQLAERGGGGAPVDDPERTNDSADELSKAMVKCKELQVANAPTTTVAPAEGSGAEAVTTTTGVGAPITDDAEFNTTSAP